MWDPGFAFSKREVATLHGYHRSFCMWSFHYRGSRAAPGLVLALDALKGARCTGLAFHVPADAADRTLEYLRERELISNAYTEAVVPIVLHDKSTVRAVTYVINTAHEQYAHALPLEAQAKVIASARGRRGPNADYLANTAAHLCDLGIEDRDLNWLARRVADLAAGD